MLFHQSRHVDVLMKSSRRNHFWIEKEGKGQENLTVVPGPRFFAEILLDIRIAYIGNTRENGGIKCDFVH